MMKNEDDEGYEIIFTKLETFYYSHSDSCIDHSLLHLSVFEKSDDRRVRLHSSIDDGSISTSYFAGQRTFISTDIIDGKLKNRCFRIILKIPWILLNIIFLDSPILNLSLKEHRVRNCRSKNGNTYLMERVFISLDNTGDSDNLCRRSENYQEEKKYERHDHISVRLITWNDQHDYREFTQYLRKKIVFFHHPSITNMTYETRQAIEGKTRATKYYYFEWRYAGLHCKILGEMLRAPDKKN